MRVCDICKKGSLIQKSGAHQYGGGWAYRAKKVRFEKEVNLHVAKVTYNPKGLRSSSSTAGLKGVRQTMRLCTKCLRRVKAEMKPVVKTSEKPTEAPQESASQAATA